MLMNMSPRLIALFMLFELSHLICAAAIPATCPSNTWQSLAKLPSPRQEHSTVALNGSSIAVIGGVVINPNGTFTTTNLFQIYNINTDTWSNGPPMPTAMNHPNVAVVNGNLYVLGGLLSYPTAPNQQINWLATGESYMWSASNNTWRTLPSAPTGTERGSADIGVSKEMIYLAGGMTQLLDSYQDSLSTVNAFNTTTLSWQSLDPAAAVLPSAIQHSFGAVVGRTFYVVAGRFFGQMRVRGEVYALDLDNLAAGWKEALLRQPVPRGGICGDVVNSTLYSFGGEGSVLSPTGVFNNSEAYDTVAETWTELQPMAVPRHGTHAVAVGKKIYIPGGGKQQDGKPVTVNGTMRFTDSTDYFDAYCV